MGMNGERVKYLCYATVCSMARHYAVSFVGREAAMVNGKVKGAPSASFVPLIVARVTGILGVHASAVFEFLAHQLPTNHTSDMTAGELLESVGQLGVAEAYSAFMQHAVEVNGFALKTPPPPGLPGNFPAGVRPAVFFAHIGSVTQRARV